MQTSARKTDDRGTPLVPRRGRRPEDSWATTPSVRLAMMACRSRDTKPEMALRGELHSRGLRFRVDRAPAGITRKADIIFGPPRLAVFVDGCFWHSCPEHGSMPVAHADYWRPKLSRTVARDREADAALARAGWTVVRVWEHEKAIAAADRICALLRQVRSSTPCRGRPLAQSNQRS